MVMSLFLLVLIVGLFPPSLSIRSVRYVQYNPPVVYPTKDFVTVEARSNYKLSCEGNRPVVWHPPKHASSTHDMYNKRVSVSYSTNPRAELNYTANIEIKDMVYTDTGSYRCSFNGSKDDTGIDSNTWIHIYVYDKFHLLTKDDFDFQQFVQYDTAVIPCMPTHPNVTVELQSDDKTKMRPDNKYIQFNPKVGFLISPILLEHQGIYTCVARFEDKESIYISQLSVLPQNSYVPPPHINKTSGEHVTVGQTLVLTCSITVDWSIQVQLTWSIPNKSKNLARMEIPESFSRNVTIGGKPFKVVEQQLILSQVEQEDQGNYECIVIDHSKNSRAIKEFIRIYERDQSFLRVWQEGSTTIQKPGGRDETVQWVVNIQAHPPPSVTWYDPDGFEIPEGEDKVQGRIRQTAGVKDVRSMLRLRGLELEDSGDYRVKVENQFNVKWENFSLIVTDPPKVSVIVINQPESGLFSFGKPYTLRCTARGYPRPRLDWTFVKCKNYAQCEKKGENLAHTKETMQGRFQLDSTLAVEASQSGRYTCIAHSGENVASAAASLFVTGVKDGFEISGEKTALEGTKVDLKCSASRYNYTEDSISWFKQTVHGLQEMSSTADPHIDLYHDRSSQFDIVKGLRFREVRTEDSGKYVCRVREPGPSGPRRRHNLTNKEEQMELRVKRYEPPKLEKTNMYGNDTLVFGKGEGVRLYCNVSGTFMPQVTWYRDDEKITVPHDNIKLLHSTQTLSIGVVVQDVDEGLYRCEAENGRGRVSATQRVIKVEAPSIYQTNLLGEVGSPDNQAKALESGETMVLQCRVLGRPHPTILWVYNGVPLVPPRVNISDDNQTLVLANVRREDAGRYECVVTNSGGSTAVYQMVEVEETSLLASIFASGIAIPVFVAVGIAVVLAITLILIAKLCTRNGRWKAPPTPPTPRLTQFDMPDEDQEAESCRLTLSRDGSPFANNGNMNVCHGCTGCNGSCHQCAGCHYSFNGIYGCTTANPYSGTLYRGGSILGVRNCTPGPGYSPGSQVLGEFAMYSQQTLPSSRFNTVKREPAHLTQERRSASPRLNPEF